MLRIFGMLKLRSVAFLTGLPSPQSRFCRFNAHLQLCCRFNMLKNASHFWHAKNLRFLDTPDTEEDEQNLVDKTIWCRDYFYKIGADPYIRDRAFWWATSSVENFSGAGGA